MYQLCGTKRYVWIKLCAKVDGFSLIFSLMQKVNGGYWRLNCNEKVLLFYIEMWKCSIFYRKNDKTIEFKSLCPCQVVADCASSRRLFYVAHKKVISHQLRRSSAQNRDRWRWGTILFYAAHQKSISLALLRPPFKMEIDVAGLQFCFLNWIRRMLYTIYMKYRCGLRIGGSNALRILLQLLRRRRKTLDLPCGHRPHGARSKKERKTERKCLTFREVRDNISEQSKDNACASGGIGRLARFRF